MKRVGTVAELWRFPVKSMGGERLERAEVTERGLVGDRLWAVWDVQKNALTNGKRLPALMTCSARFVAEPPADAVDDAVPPVVITFPDGTDVVSDQPEASARLSAFLGREVTMSPRRPASDRAHYRAPRATIADMRQQFGIADGEALPDFSMMPASMLVELARYATPPGTYFDAYALHILTTASVRAVAALAPDADVVPLRFRPNLLIEDGSEGLAEVAWCGGTLRVGGLTAGIDIPTVRCSMPTRAQPGLAPDPAVLRAVVEHANRCLGAYGRVERGGTVRVGDPVEVEPPRATRVGSWMRSGARSLKRLALRAGAAAIPDE